MNEDWVEPAAYGKYTYVVPESGNLRVMVHTQGAANLFLLNEHQTRNWEGGVATYLPVSASAGSLRIHVLERQAMLSGSKLNLLVVNRSSERLLVQHYASIR